jgi:hypothetical protein
MKEAFWHHVRFLWLIQDSQRMDLYNWQEILKIGEMRIDPSFILYCRVAVESIEWRRYDIN